MNLEYFKYMTYRVAQNKRPAWLDHNCSLKIQYFVTKLHTQFVQYLLITVMHCECDINKTVEMVLIVKQQIFGLLCCFALHYLDEGCRLMDIANYTMHHFLG